MSRDGGVLSNEGKATASQITAASQPEEQVRNEVGDPPVVVFLIICENEAEESRRYGVPNGASFGILGCEESIFGDDRTDGMRIGEDSEGRNRDGERLRLGLVSGERGSFGDEKGVRNVPIAASCRLSTRLALEF